MQSYYIGSSEGQVVRNASKALTMPPFAPKSSSFKLDFSKPSIVEIRDCVGDFYCSKGRNWLLSSRDKATKRTRDKRRDLKERSPQADGELRLVEGYLIPRKLQLVDPRTPAAQFDLMEACAVSRSRFGLNQVLCKAWRAAAHVKAPGLTASASASLS